MSEDTAQVSDPILVPALKVGLLTGCSGILAGGAVAVMRSAPAVGLFALGTGVNCFALGSTFWVIRSTAFRVLHDPSTGLTNFSPQDKTYISGVSGALTGLSMGLILRGRSNAIPGAIVWGLFGLGGQYAYNAADARHGKSIGNKVSQDERDGSDHTYRTSWNPVRKLTNNEYKAMLSDKLLALDAEIALTDDELKKLEKQINLSSE